MNGAALLRGTSIVLVILLLGLAALPIKPAHVSRRYRLRLADWRLAFVGTGLMIACAVATDLFLNKAP